MRCAAVKTSEGGKVTVVVAVVLFRTFRTGCFATERVATVPEPLTLEVAELVRDVGTYSTPNEARIDVFRKFRTAEIQNDGFCCYFFIQSKDGNSPYALIIQVFQKSASVSSTRSGSDITPCECWRLR